jgi:phosphoribosylformimino-5-aminoimidazole carboxamide ribotide isomerase
MRKSNQEKNKFQILPAIDLLDGRCVRLLRGNYSKVTHYDQSPFEQLKRFEEAGFEYVHIIDLDGAQSKGKDNFDLILELIKSTSLKVEVGGGIRNEEQFNQLLDAGVWQIIISSLFFKNEYIEFIEKIEDKITLGLDIKSDQVCFNGWINSNLVDYRQIKSKLDLWGINRIIFTDISKDGTLNGPNINLASSLKNQLNREVVVAGGVSSPEDLVSIKKSGLDGVVVGKAIYENGFALNAWKI